MGVRRDLLFRPLQKLLKSLSWSSAAAEDAEGSMRRVTSRSDAECERRLKSRSKSRPWPVSESIIYRLWQEAVEGVVQSRGGKEDRKRGR